MNQAPPDRATLPPPPWPNATAIALFLDVDGTLIEFANRPHEVVVDAALRSLLRALSRRLEGALAPLSGRSLREIDALLGLPRGAAAGLHGAELRRADGVAIVTSHAHPALSKLCARANALVATLPGVFVESKPNSVALHYRGATDAADAVHEVARTLLHEAGADYALQAGNHVLELKPAGIDKGCAVAILMRSEPFAARVPWVLGDDLTDEHAFTAAQALGGVGVIVGPRRPTAARYALADPPAARAWLAALNDSADTAQPAGSAP